MLNCDLRFIIQLVIEVILWYRIEIRFFMSDCVTEFKIWTTFWKKFLKSCDDTYDMMLNNELIITFNDLVHGDLIEVIITGNQTFTFYSLRVH